MLTEAQKGMINHCMQHRVDMLYLYFSKKSQNPCQEVIQCIERAKSSPLNDTEFSDEEISHLTGLGGKNPVGTLEKELRGIFNPNFRILEKLGVINNVRDSEKMTLEAFGDKAHELQAYSYESVVRVVSCHPQLKEYMKSVSDHCTTISLTP